MTGLCYLSRAPRSSTATSEIGPSALEPPVTNMRAPMTQAACALRAVGCVEDDGDVVTICDHVCEAASDGRRHGGRRDMK
jgi:hypothetical protein